MLPPKGKSDPSRALAGAPNLFALGTRSDSSEGLEALAGRHHIAVANITGKRALIMLVDDEPHVCALTQLMLCDEGYKVVTALDGDQAISIFEKLKPHISLVILDLIMPSMDGEDVFNRLRELDPNISVVLSSGFTDQAKLDRMLAHGLRGTIAKPYTQRRLLGQVREFVGALSLKSGQSS